MENFIQYKNQWSIAKKGKKHLISAKIHRGFTGNGEICEV